MWTSRPLGNTDAPIAPLALINALRDTPVVTMRQPSGGFSNEPSVPEILPPILLSVAEICEILPACRLESDAARRHMSSSRLARLGWVRPHAKPACLDQPARTGPVQFRTGQSRPAPSHPASRRHNAGCGQRACRTQRPEL